MKKQSTIVEQKTTCTVCLEKIDEGSFFCMYCGSQAQSALEKKFILDFKVNEDIYVRHLIDQISIKLKKIKFWKTNVEEETKEKFRINGAKTHDNVRFYYPAVDIATYHDRFALDKDNNLVVHHIHHSRIKKTAPISDYFKNGIEIEYDDLKIPHFTRANQDLDNFFDWVKELNKTITLEITEEREV